MRLMGAITSAAEGHLDAVAASATAALALPSGAAAELTRVEARLRAAVTTRDHRLSEMALHGIEAGGKRLRPLLVIAAAKAVGGRGAVGGRVIDAGAAVELVHLASLYHDDVLDSAATRRGRPSANARWGNHAAVLGGDVLLAHAFRLAAGIGERQLRRLCDTLAALCSGQVAECETQFDRARAIQQYDASIRGKTAALLATSCWVGAATAGGAPDTIDALGDYGTEIGVAFQVADDVLDLYGQSHAIGKPAGNDLREGVFTLPVLMALRDDPGLGDLLTEGIDDAGVREVARRVRRAGADREAVGYALDHLRTALARLAEHDLHAVGTELLTELARLVLAPLERLGLAERARLRRPTHRRLPEAGAA